LFKAAVIGLAAAALVVGFWVGTFFLFGHFGFNNQATPFYGFSSGVGPMLLTAISMGGIIGTMWHKLNCHEDGCWNIGKHMVNGTPWCNLHHGNARHSKTEAQLLEEILEELKKR